jgi:hypothetical protein
MLFTFVFFYLGWKFFRDKSIKRIFKASYFLGLVVILVNVFWVYHFTGSYFEGSDATAYYLSAKNIKNNFGLLDFINIRYIGFNIYQIIAAYPLFDNELSASILIKLTSWSLFFLSCVNLNKNLTNHLGLTLTKDQFVYYSIFFMGLWLSLYNFRDIMILTCLISISSIYISDNKYRLLKIIIFLYLLFYFRFFYVALLLVSFFMAKGIDVVWKKNILKSRKINLLFVGIFFIIFFAFSLTSIDVINVMLAQNENVLNSQMRYSVKASDPIVSFLKAMFAGNPIEFLVNYFFENISRAFVISPISAMLMSLIYLYSYVYFMQLFVIIFFTKKIFLNSGNSFLKLNSSKITIFVFSVIFLTFFSLFAYSLTFEGMQERIRVPLLILLSVIILIIKSDKKFRILFEQTKIISILMVFAVFGLTLFAQ